MNLIEVYIHEVTRRLPEKSREDIGLELHSTIEDMLPDDYSEEDVKECLKKMGNPAILASGYRDKPMHLIGPLYYDVYITLLKMILPIAAVISLITMNAEYFIGYHGQEAVINVILDIVGLGISKIIEVSIQVFFWLTLIFAILERTAKGKGEQSLTASLKKWTPDDLKDIPYIPRKKAISKCVIFGSLMWTAVWATLYFYADHLVGLYRDSGNGLKFVTPILNQEVLIGYWPFVVIMIGFEIVLSLYKLIKGKWTKRIAISNTVLQIIGTIVFIVILVNSNLFNQDFITYMTDSFTMTVNQFKEWIIGGGIFCFIVSAAISVFDGFRKASIR